MALTEKQLQILATAEKLFACKGFDGTSVRDIAEEAGVNIAMISYYFGSKEGLMKALFEERTSYMKLRMETLLKDEALTPFEKIDRLIEDYVARVFQKQPFHKIVLYEQMLQKNSAITNLMQDLKRGNTELVQRLLQEGQERGDFRQQVDVVLLMNTLFGTINQTFINQNHYRRFHHLEEAEETVFYEQLKAELIHYIKTLFKAILRYEP